MADEKVKLNRMCMETENGHHSEERKMTDITVNGTKITNLNQFCLEKIFSYLNLRDLLNVADANSYLKIATYVPFVRNFVGNSIEIDRAGLNRHLEKKCSPEDAVLISDMKIIMKTDVLHPRLMEKDILITDLKSFFQLLRCFGEMITDLKSTYDAHYNNNRSDNYHRIGYYINKFCSQNLKNLESDLFGWESLEKPFINLENLTIMNRNCQLKEPCLSRLFPKLCRLRVPQLFSEEGTNKFSIVLSQYFPNLHHLDLGYSFGVYDVDIGNLLKLNPQLRSFKISLRDYSYLDRYSEYLQFIESLDISIKTSASIPVNSIYFNNVKQFNAYFYISRDFNIFPKIPFLFRQLKEFNIKGRSLKYSDFLLDFLSENTSIEKLTFDNDFLVFRLIKTGRLQQSLPFLKDIFIDFIFTTAETIRIVSKYLPYLGFLRTLNFSIIRETEGNLEESSELFGNEWRMRRNRIAINDEIGIIRDDVTLERI